MGLRMKQFNIFGVHIKIEFLGGIYRKGLPKKGGLNSLQFYGVELGKKEGDGVFEEGGADTPMHTMHLLYLFIQIKGKLLRDFLNYFK